MKCWDILRRKDEKYLWQMKEKAKQMQEKKQEAK